MDIMNYGLREKYDQFSKFGDRLADMKKMVQWESFRPILSDLYKNDTDQGGRPNIDPVLMLKILFLQSVYNLVDESVEREMHNRIDFMNFLDYPENIPDSRTVWLFRERLSSTGKDKVIWKSIWRSFESKGIIIKKGTVQDATFIESDPGKHGKKKPPVPVDPEFPEMKRDVRTDMPAKDETAPTGAKKRMTREEKRQAKIRNAEKKRLRREERKYGKTRRSKDGTWTKKNNKAHFGYKLHTSQGTDVPLIREFVVTTASLHDSNVDLGIPDIPNYRDKGYYGSGTRGRDSTMDRASRKHPLSIDQIKRNRRITRKRSPGERPYSIIKCTFHLDHVFVTMARRVRVKAMFSCLGYNLLTFLSMRRRGKIAVAV